MADMEIEADPELQKKVDDLRGDFAARAQQIVHKVMPQKVLTLDEMLKTNPIFGKTTVDLETPDFDSIVVAAQERVAATNGDGEGHASKKRKISDGTAYVSSVSIKSNQRVKDVLTILKRELMELIENLNVVKIWIQLNIPRIEDGNNFGVGVQEETVSELGRAEDNAFSMLESMTKYYVSRAKLVSKVMKYPEIADYKQSIRELDEKEYINMRLCAIDLRNNYAILHDIVIKNLEKLKTPRNSSHLSALF